MEPERNTFFFLHIMKTAGSSFSWQLHVNFPGKRVFPRRRSERRQAEYWRIDEVRSLTPEAIAPVRAFHGHFPFLVAEMVGADTTLTLLRDPVERTISHINHCARQPAHLGWSAESIYEDPWLHPAYFRNYQVKQFALTAEDRPEAHNDDIDLADGRLAIAMVNLDKVSLFGLTERYDEFLAEVQARFGWKIGSFERVQVAPEHPPVSAALRRRIEADNRLDLEFYEYARQRYELGGRRI